MVPMILSVAALVLNLSLSVWFFCHVRRDSRDHKGLIAYTDNAVKEATELSRKALSKAEAMEKGIVPDYEEAKAAANSLNDFNRGISNLLGFDPMESLKAARNEQRGKDE